MKSFATFRPCTCLVGRHDSKEREKAWGGDDRARSVMVVRRLSSVRSRR